MKTQKTVSKILFFVVILMTSCGIANAQNSSTIKIGTQNWMSKNLNVSTYRNGDSIPQVQDETEWSNLTTGAWCYYENGTENGTIYGKLYNWFAVNDPRGLAPEGFHIPNDTEWNILTGYLGESDIAATKIKSNSDWDENDSGTETNGFAGLPGGSRDSNGKFGKLGAFGNWWSSSDSDTPSAWPREFDYGKGRNIHSLQIATENRSDKENVNMPIE